ncbi:MAG: heavy-metal-associated domain-containing protein [Salinibacter sp.]
MTVRSLLPALLAVLLAGGAFAPDTLAQDRHDTVQNPDATVYVDGLACPFCAYGLEKKLGTLDAIQQMEVQLEKGRVLLAFKKEKSLTKNQIQKAVKEAGFTARKIEFPNDAPSASASS